MLLSGITSEHQAAHIHEAQDTYTPSEEEASQRPIIKLVDTLIGDGITSRAKSAPNTIYVALSRTYRHLAGCVQRRLTREGV